MFPLRSAAHANCFQSVTSSLLRQQFDEKPDEKTRDELKSRGFKWSPKNSAWQRKLTPNAIYITKRMFKFFSLKQFSGFRA